MNKSSLCAGILIMVSDAWDKEVNVRLDRDISANIWAEFLIKPEIASVKNLEKNQTDK